MRLYVIIRREFTEGIRQRWLLVTLATVLGLIMALGLATLSLTDWASETPDRQLELQFWLRVFGTSMEDPVAGLAGLVVFGLQALVFNQLMSMTAVMAGHAGIHERQCGTLPFLLLAPVGRFEVLFGKVIGALSVPFLIYAAIGGAASVAATQFASTGPSAEYLPPSSGWFATFFISVPVWSMFTGTICVLFSSVARDVRTAQQASWAVVFFATFVLSPLLVGLMPYGAGLQLGLAAVGLVLALGALAIGSWLIGRDLTR